MTLVQGALKLVTDTPDEVSQVWIQAPKERLHGTGMVTTGRASEQVINGVVSFNALPGAAVMVLLVNGIPSTTVKLLIPDKANATLRECIEAVGLADAGELSELESLSLEVARIAAQIASADRLEAWASETASAAAQAQLSNIEAGLASGHASAAASNARKSESNAKQSEINSKQSEIDAQSAATQASTAASNVRGELQDIADDAASSAEKAGISQAEAFEHEVNSLAAAERAEFAAEETIQQVEGDFATRNYADSKAWVKRDLAKNEDLNTVITRGLYTVINYLTAVSLLNRPEEPNAIDRASLEVQTAEGGAQQTWYPMGVASRADMPVMRRRRDTAGTWTEWERINAFTPAKETYLMQSISAAKWEKRALVRDEDLDNIVDPGVYYVPTYTIANNLVNRPTLATAINPATVEVLATGRGQISQVWTTLPAADKPAPVMSRRRDNGGTWTEWEETDAKVDAPEYDPLEAVGMTATGASGELTGIRSLLRGLTPGAAPVWSWWAPAPTAELEMPTHDGAGQTCHPSVLYFPNGWNGWKYWMAHTPYPNFQEAHEDPNIAVSNDGTTWQVPEGLTNPLDDGLGRPNYHNSDTHLVMHGNTMVVTWRTVDRPNGGQNIIYARTSADGVNWTAKTEVLKVPLGSAESTFVAQSLVKMPTGWRLYGIRSNYGPNRLGYYETSVNTIPKTSDWGSAKDCDLGEIPTGRDMWHSEVQRLSANDWVAVISDGRYGSTGVDGDIYLARSTDGIKWDVSPLPLTPRANGVINSLYKTGFVVSGTGTDRTFDLWVSGYRTDKRTWGIYRTLAEYRGSNQAEALPITRVGVGSPEGKVEAPVGSIYTDSAATNGAIRWIKTSGTGNTGWRVEYGDTGWRNVSSELSNILESGKVFFRRKNDTVDIVAEWAKFIPGGTSQMPVGFRPFRNDGFPFYASANLATPVAQFRIGYTGSITIHVFDERYTANDQGTLTTSDPWPTTLPGTPV